jgi:hypothetical protein
MENTKIIKGSILKCSICGRFFNPEKSSSIDYCLLCEKHKDSEYNSNLFNLDEIKKQKNVIPPKRKWVQEYCNERKNDIDVQKFMEYYEKTGWKQKSGKPINDWKRAVITWETNQKRPIKVNWVINAFDMSDNDLITELKKRGYKGDLNKKIEI